MPSVYSLVAAIGLAGIPLAHSAAWQDVQCTDPSLTNAAINPAIRWSAADVNDAWKAAVQTWNGGTVLPGNIALTFSESVSNFFHGPDQWNCKDVGDIPCSDVVQCHSTNHPAGWLIMNSFSSLHQVHQHIYNALQDAESNMAPNMGTFASTFAPQLESDSDLFSDLIAGITTFIGLGSAFAWNVAIKEAGIFTNDNYRGFWKDVFNSHIALAMTVGKNHLPSAKSALDTQNSLSSALGSVVHSWQGVETGVLEVLFSGDSGSIGNLTDLFQGGMMTQIPNSVDLSSFTAEAQKILYGQLIPIAWSIAPGDLHPIILRSSEPCSSKATGKLDGFMTDDTAAQTHFCYDGYTFYLVNAHYKDDSCHAKECPPAPNGGDMQFQALPGGTFDVLSGDKFGGVRVDDIVISSYQGYQLNGYKNGYQMPELSSNIDGKGTQGDFVFQNGIQTPGFFSIPICVDIDAAILNIQHGPAKGDPNWPCGPATGTPFTNLKGTNIHVNSGCVDINGSKRCHPDSYNVAYQNSDTSSATIYAKFDGNNKWDANVTAGCKLSAQFPANYGDVYVGADNCLYDAGGNQINGQCCTAATSDQVTNPYYNGSPKPGTQGTKLHVNSGCISINKSKRCHPDSYKIDYQNSDTSLVTIYAKFDGSNTWDTNTTPGCKLDAQFPANYGDIYFGNDNCLYDGSGNQINGQCCTAGTSDQVPNPYYTGAPKPAPNNNKGTNIHVNGGCISINGSKRCHPDSYNVAYQNSDTSGATIYAKFDGSNTWDTNTTPGCKLNAKFPANYGDIYFGNDNCLYDSSGNQINSQCCTAGTSDQVPNPYYTGAPKPAPNNNKGTNIHVNGGCISINGSKRCHPDSYNVSYQNSDTSTATIYAGFNGGDKSATVTPGCKLDAKFPANYGDIYFGNGNCLYDSSGNQINGQCCTAGTSDQVPNPYL